MYMCVAVLHLALDTCGICTGQHQNMSHMSAAFISHSDLFHILKITATKLMVAENYLPDK